jgi:hypothetical protein
MLPRSRPTLALVIVVALLAPWACSSSSGDANGNAKYSTASGWAAHPTDPRGGDARAAVQLSA